MKTLILLTIILTISNFAMAEDLNCRVKQNTEVIYANNFNLPVNSSASLGDFGSFRIKVNNFGKSMFQIEVFDGDIPSRNYTDGVLRAANDQLRWSVWNREILLEAICTLIKK